jgi:RimJ/RimL family protein N-acetyltransferase
VASIRLAERLGFRWEGVLRDRSLVDGTYRTVAMYALLENEFRE